MSTLVSFFFWILIILSIFNNFAQVLQQMYIICDFKYSSTYEM